MTRDILEVFMVHLTLMLRHIMTYNVDEHKSVALLTVVPKGI